MQAVRVLPLWCMGRQRETTEWSGLRDSYNHAREGDGWVARCGCQGVQFGIRWFSRKETGVWIPVCAGMTGGWQSYLLNWHTVVSGGGTIAKRVCAVSNMR